MHPVPTTRSPPPAAGSGDRRRGWARWGRWLLLGLLLLTGSVIAAWGMLVWAILPRIDHWRPQLEMRASHALGVPVTIGVIEVTDRDGWWRWNRAIELREVRLYEPPSAAEGAGAPLREALRLPSVRAALSPTSLLPGADGRWRLRFAQLLIDGAQLAVRRDRQGRVWIAGLSSTGPAALEEGGAAADWFFSQPEFAIRGGALTWTDEWRGAAPLVLRDVDLVVRNGVRRHALRLDATPPADWGTRFSLRGDFTQPLLAAHEVAASGGALGNASSWLARPGQWQRWRGSVYAELPQIDLAPLRRQVALPFAPSAGTGALRAWVEVRDAQPVAATADLALRDVVLQLAPDAEPLAFTRLDGRLSGRLGSAREPGGELEAQQFGFVTADGLRWPASDARLRWRLDEQGAIAGGDLRAQRLDLALLARTLGRLPAGWLASGLREQLAGYAPAGVVRDLDARWDGPPAAPQRYRVQARAQGLAVAAQPAAAEAASAPTDTVAPPSGATPSPPNETKSTPAVAGASEPPAVVGRPGVQGLDLDLSATEAGGEAHLALRAGALDLPGLFAEPRIALGRFDGTLSWRIDHSAAGDALALRLRDARFANDDTEGEFNASWRRAAADRGPGTLELAGRLAHAEAARVPRYLPLQLPAGVRHYLERALQGGRVGAVDFKLRGDLRDFPFAPAEPRKRPLAPGTAGASGEFRVAAQLDGVRLAYLPGGETGADGVPQPVWPAFTDVKGELVFDRQSMALRKLQARLGDVGGGGFELSRINGDIRNLLDRPALMIEGRGRGPLADALRYVAATPIAGWTGGALAEIRAERGAQPPAELQLALQIPLSTDEPTRVRGSVQLAGNDLQLRDDLPALLATKARIAFTERGFALSDGSARALGGEARFDGASDGDTARFNVQGTVAIDALRRSPDAAPWSRLLAPLSGQTGYRLTLGVRGERTDWRLTSNLAGLAIDLPAPLRKAAEPIWPLQLQSVALREGGGDGGLPREQLRLELGPEGARVLQGQWLRERRPDGVRVLRGGLGVRAAAPTPTEGVAAQIDVAELDLDAWQRAAEAALPTVGGDSGYAPTTLALRAQTLRASGRPLTRVVAGATRNADDGVWRINIDATELGGYAEYRAAGPGRGAEGRVYARLARLALPKSEAEAVSSLLDRAPASVPALDIVVDDLELRGKRLGRVEIEAQNRAVGGDATAREWRLAKLRIVTPEAQLGASGRWVAPDGSAGGGRRRSELDFQLDIADGGGLLARLGEPGVVRGAKGRLSGRLAWLGSPLAIDYPSLGGDIAVAIDGGQFLQADPGLAKLLGVLSLQALPRRLLLDFRDLFERGFAFDRVDGDVRIAQGVASTRNLRLRGVQAVVLMEGSADLDRETQDLRVWIVPEINTGAASLAVAAINPAVGIGSFLAQLFLRRPLAEAGTREFHITGPWAEPVVDKVERKPGDPRPPTGDAASAPAAAAPGPANPPTR